MLKSVGVLPVGAVLRADGVIMYLQFIKVKYLKYIFKIKKVHRGISL